MSTARWRDALALILGPVLAVFATNAAFEQWGWPLLAADAPGLPHTVQARLRTAPPTDLLVMGSSVGVFGVSADRLASRTGGTVLNVSRHGASAQATAMMLPDVLRLSPKTVVVMISALELRADQVPDWGRIYDPQIAWALRSKLPQDPSAHLEGMLGWGSLLYRHREGVRGQIAERFGLKSARFLVGGGEPMEGLQAEFAAARLDGTGPNIAALMLMAERLGAADIQLVLCPTPVHPDVIGELFPAASQAILAGFSVSVPAEALGDYTEAAFQDPIHLSQTGRDQLTDRLADWLAAN
ncbi:MAG: hypothetical protein ACI8RZ_000683 [Myxococcota bacterium]